MNNTPKPLFESLQKKKTKFLESIERHILSEIEYGQGHNRNPLQITKEEFESLKKEGVIKEVDRASESQALLFVSFQEEPLHISISETDEVLLHLSNQEEIIIEEAPKGPMYHGNRRRAHQLNTREDNEKGFIAHLRERFKNLL